MRGMLVLAVLLPLSSASCQHVVVSTESVVPKAELGEMGLAGSWKPVKKHDDPFPPSEKAAFTILGPDESGTYCVFGDDDPKEKLTFTIERLPNTERYCLADVVLSDKRSGQRLHLPVYCLAEDKRLVIWFVSSTKVEQELAEKQTDFAVENLGLFEIIKGEEQILRDLLMKHGQRVTGGTTHTCIKIRFVARIDPLMIWEIVSRDVTYNPLDDGFCHHCRGICMVADGAEAVSELPKAGVGCLGDSRGYQANALSLQTMRQRVPRTLATASLGCRQSLCRKSALERHCHGPTEGPTQPPSRSSRMALFDASSNKR